MAINQLNTLVLDLIRINLQRETITQAGQDGTVDKPGSPKAEATLTKDTQPSNNKLLRR